MRFRFFDAYQGSSFAELLAEAENNAELVKEQGSAMREAVKQLRQWSGIRDGEIDETELPDEVDHLRRELLRCSGAHVRGSRSIVDGLREVAAEAYARRIASERSDLGAEVNRCFTHYEVKVDSLGDVTCVRIDVEINGNAADLVRSLLTRIDRWHLPCPVKLSVTVRNFDRGNATTESRRTLSRGYRTGYRFQPR